MWSMVASTLGLVLMVTCLTERSELATPASDRALSMSDGVNLPDTTTFTRGLPAAH